MTVGGLLPRRLDAAVRSVLAWSAVIAVLPWLLGGPFLGPAAAQAPVPLSVERVKGLSFGQVVSDSSQPGTVVLDPVTGTRTFSGGAFELGGFPRRGEFLVRGAPFAGFFITLPGQITISTGLANQDIVVSAFTSSPSPTGTIGSDGTATVFVGATLNLQIAPASGTYKGLFQIIVDSAG